MRGAAHILVTHAIQGAPLTSSHIRVDVYWWGAAHAALHGRGIGEEREQSTEREGVAMHIGGCVGHNSTYVRGVT